MSFNNLKDYQLILASGSPRRQQLLRDLDIDFVVDVRPVDEVYPATLKGAEITEFLAKLKSESFATNCSEKDIVITSDTIVWLADEALGKPKDFKEAENMLLKLSGKEHEVITSVCLRRGNQLTVFSDTVRVFFKTLTLDEIHYYINTYKPYDKAGAYGIQEWIGKIGIDKIEGSYFTVMGFPVHKLYKELKKI
jgi:septum formation protein